MTALDPVRLRNAFGAFPTGVTVVATRDDNGRPVGFTANSFSSVSLDPPLLLVCPARSLSCFDVFERCERFSVNVLAEGQEAVANIFAGYKGDRFSMVQWHDDRDARPLIDGAAACFSCDMERTVDAGDHGILIGAIQAFSTTGARGLGYAAGHYFSLGLEREAASAPRAARRAIAGAIIEHQGHVLLESTPSGLRPLQQPLDDRARVRATLAAHFSRAGIDVDIGKAYSIFDDDVAGDHYIYFIASAANDRTGDTGEYVPVDALAGRRYVTSAHAEMLSRFALEYRNRRFGLYIGDEAGGDVHSFN